MVYTAPPKQTRRERRRPGGKLVSTKAIVTLDDRRYVLDGPVAVLGRSRECDCVLSDPNVSRRHAELRRGQTGDWQVVDLGSTNGIKVNDRQVDRPGSRPGTWSPSGRPGSPSTSSNSPDGHRADRGSAQVRLPRRPVPVPVLGGPAPSGSCAAPRRRRPRRRASTRSAPGAGRRPPTPGWSRHAVGDSTRRRALRPVRRAVDRALGRCRRPDRGPLRIRRSTRASTPAGPATTLRT